MMLKLSNFSETLKSDFLIDINLDNMIINNQLDKDALYSELKTSLKIK